MSGFKFEVELGESVGKGLGVFTKEAIPCGALVWTPTPDNHRTFNEAELNIFVEQNPLYAEFVLNHVYGWRDVVIFAIDDAAFVNHSSNPNLTVGHVVGVDDDEQGCFAARDIDAGEELLDNYANYTTPKWYLDLCAAHGVESSADVVRKYS